MVRDFLKLNNLEKRLLGIFVLALACVILLYGYFIDQAVVNIAERKSIERKIAMLSTELGELEHEYASLQSEVTHDRAIEFGFVEVEEAAFVVREDSGRFLTLSNE